MLWMSAILLSGPMVAHTDNWGFDRSAYPRLTDAMSAAMSERLIYQEDKSPEYVLSRIIVDGTSIEEWNEAFEIIRTQRKNESRNVDGWYASFQAQAETTCPSDWEILEQLEGALTFERHASDCASLDVQHAIYKVLYGKHEVFVLIGKCRTQMDAATRTSWIKLLGSAEIKRKVLFEAARDGEIERVQELIEAGEDINQTTSGKTPLEFAVENGFRETGQAAVVELLISHGARIDTTDEMGRTLLVYALTNGAPVVKALLDAGIDVNAQDGLGRTALSNAITGKDDEVFDLLLEYGADVNLSSDGGSIELQSAIANDHIDRVVKLLDLGVDVNARDHEDQTALFAAADGRKPRVNAVQVLLDRGAVANIEDNYGNSPQMLAQKNLDAFLESEKAAMKRAAAGKSFNTTPEMIQQQKRDYQRIVALLEEAGGNELAPVEMSLSYAARIGDLAAVRDYLRKGGDVGAIDVKSGYSPLIWALFRNHERVANTLLDSGADPNIVGVRGETALMLAIDRGASIETIRHLLDSGADPNLQTKAGTALIAAAMSSPNKVVKLLLDSGADPNLSYGEDCYTASYGAMMAGRRDILRLLKAAGAE